MSGFDGTTLRAIAARGAQDNRATFGPGALKPRQSRGAEDEGSVVVVRPIGRVNTREDWEWDEYDETSDPADHCIGHPVRIECEWGSTMSDQRPSIQVGRRYRESLPVAERFLDLRKRGVDKVSALDEIVNEFGFGSRADATAVLEWMGIDDLVGLHLKAMGAYPRPGGVPGEPLPARQTVVYGEPIEFVTKSGKPSRVEHGTASGRSYGCPCKPCVEAGREQSRMAKRRQARRERGVGLPALPSGSQAAPPRALPEAPTVGAEAPLVDRLLALAAEYDDDRLLALAIEIEES